MEGDNLLKWQIITSYGKQPGLASPSLSATNPALYAFFPLSFTKLSARSSLPEQATLHY